MATPSLKTHRIGIIGCGWILPFHVSALQSLGPRAKIIWLADSNLERAEKSARSIGARAIADYREGLSEVDAVFILLPHHLHHPVTLECLKAGCDVLVEKPIAITLAEADEMTVTAERLGRTLMVAYPHRYRPCMQLFKEAALGGKYGRLFMLDGLMDESLQGYALGWIAKKAFLGGGVFFSSSPHMLDVMLWIAGEVRAASMVGTKAGAEMEGEDTAASVIKFQNGVIGVTRHMWASPKSRIWFTMTAVCEKAHITLTTTPMGDLATEGCSCPWKTRIVAVGKTEEVLLDNDEGLDLLPEVKHFLDCVDTKSKPQTDGHTARKVIELVLNAYQEAESRKANP